MSTHFMSSSTNVFYTRDTYNPYSFGGLPEVVNVTVLDEGVGSNCKYHKVYVDDPALETTQFYQKEYFVLTSSVYRLPDTAESAPRVCVRPSSYIDTYEPPDWVVEVNKPFLNKKDQKYYATIVSNYKDLTQLQRMKTETIREGTRKILEYCYKDSTDSAIDTLLSYFIFANFEQYYIPVEPNLRIKCQISIHKKYIDALEDYDDSLANVEADMVFGYMIRDIDTKLSTLSSLLNQYHRDMNFNMAKVTSINLSKDATKIINFNNNLNRYFELNNITINPNVGFVEFAVDNCYRIKSVSYSNGRNCYYIKIGLSELRAISPYNNPSLVSLISKLDEISKIDYCNVPWYDFLNNYYYPRQNIPPMSYPLENFEQAINGIIDSVFSVDIVQLEQDKESVRKTLKGLFNAIQTQTELNIENATIEELKEIMVEYKSKLIDRVGLDLLINVDIKQEWLKDITINNVVDKLKKIKLCKLVFEAIECLNQLISITEAEEVFINFSYQEQRYELIPFLEDSEKRIVFRQLLNEEGISRGTIYNLITKFETEQSVLENIQNQTKEEIVETLINYMVS